MKAEELRIGNWIADRGLKEWQIDHWETINKVSGKANTVMCGGVIMETHPPTEYVDYLKPIKLTEDWLLRFGFKEVKPRSGVQKSFIKNGIRINLSNSGNFYFKELPVKVHTLQNIFYFNTGNELTLTTPTP